MLLLAVMSSWQIDNQGVTPGRKATKKHISLALEVHLFITNTEFAKSPYLSYTTITSGNMTQKDHEKNLGRNEVNILITTSGLLLAKKENNLLKQRGKMKKCNWPCTANVFFCPL